MLRLTVACAVVTLVAASIESGRKPLTAVPKAHTPRHHRCSAADQRRRAQTRGQRVGWCTAHDQHPSHRLAAAVRRSFQTTTRSSWSRSRASTVRSRTRTRAFSSKSGSCRGRHNRPRAGPLQQSRLPHPSRPCRSLRGGTHHSCQGRRHHGHRQSNGRGPRRRPRARGPSRLCRRQSWPRTTKSNCCSASSSLLKLAWL